MTPYEFIAIFMTGFTFCALCGSYATDRWFLHKRQVRKSDGGWRDEPALVKNELVPMYAPTTGVPRKVFDAMAEACRIARLYVWQRKEWERLCADKDAPQRAIQACHEQCDVVLKDLTAAIERLNLVEPQGTPDKPFDGIEEIRKYLVLERECMHAQSSRGECCTSSPPHCILCCVVRSCWKGPDSKVKTPKNSNLHEGGKA